MEIPLEESMVFARVGWAARYEGDENDLPIGGGSFNAREPGWERFNFKIVKDIVYGYFQPSRDGPGDRRARIKLERVAPGTFYELPPTMRSAFPRPSAPFGCLLDQEG
jgi:hypothetical protein